jgi:CheY-like chemotaxis protein
MLEDLEKKVLVIEDDMNYRTNIVNSLFREFSVSEAEDGEQAIDKILSYKPDVIVLDLLLPKLDGFEVLTRIRQYPDPKIAQIPVVILSNLSENEDVLKTQKLNVSAYFVKSNTTLEEVLQRIRQIALFDQGGQEAENPA